ncbi:hypothetical protein MACH15_11320 [Maricaulis maris]|nr:hypothetical protein MACH15_11320 [Maricaulis maris]
MDRIIEVLGLEPVGDPVEHLVVIEKRAQEGLFGIKIVRCRIERLGLAVIFVRQESSGHAFGIQKARRGYTPLRRPGP